MDGSFKEFLQMAQVSAQISHDHIATAFHFLISNRTAAGAEDDVTADAAVFPSSPSIV